MVCMTSALIKINYNNFANVVVYEYAQTTNYLKGFV